MQSGTCSTSGAVTVCACLELVSGTGSTPSKLKAPAAEARVPARTAPAEEAAAVSAETATLKAGVAIAATVAVAG